MVNAWLMDDSDADQRLPHKREPNVPVSLDALRELGVLYWHLDPEAESSAAELARIREERGYSYTDTINVAPDTLPNYEAKIKMFFEEHMHSDEVSVCVCATPRAHVRPVQRCLSPISRAAGDPLRAGRHWLL